MGSASVAIVLIAVVIQHTLCLRLGEREWIATILRHLL